MKLAEALSLRKDIANRIAEMQRRISRNAVVQEGERPTEDPETLLAEMEQLFSQLLEIIQKINKANLTPSTANQYATQADALAARNIYRQKAAAYRAVASAGSGQFRFTRTELKNVTVIKVAELEKKADQAAKLARDIDVQVQAANWTIDVD